MMPIKCKYALSRLCAFYKCFGYKIFHSLRFIIVGIFYIINDVIFIDHKGWKESVGISVGTIGEEAQFIFNSVPNGMVLFIV